MDPNTFINRRLAERKKETPLTIRAREALLDDFDRDVSRRLEERHQKRQEERAKEYMRPGQEGFDAAVFGRTTLDRPDGPKTGQEPARVRTPEVREEERQQMSPEALRTTRFDPTSLEDWRNYDVRGAVDEVGELAAGFNEAFYRKPVENIENLVGGDFGSLTDSERGLRGPQRPGQGVAATGEGLGTALGMARDLGVSSVAGMGVGNLVRGTQLARNLAQGGTTARNVGRVGRVVPEEVAASAIYTGMQGEDFTKDLATVLGARGAFRAVGAGARTVPKIREGRRFLREEAQREAESTAQRLGVPLGEAKNINAGVLGRLNNQVSKGISNVTEPIRSSAPAARIKEYTSQAYAKMIRSEQPILNQLRKGEEVGKLPDGTSRHVGTLIRDVKTANQQAEFYMRTNQNFQRVVEGGLNKRQLKDLNKYIEARAEINLIEAGIKPSKGRLAKFKKVVEQGSEDYAQRFDSLVRYNADLRKRMVDEGLISKADAESLATREPEYIRIQREVDNMSQLRRGVGSGTASIRQTSAVQKRGESVAEVKDLLQVSAERTSQIEKEILRNRAAKALIDNLEKLDLADPARTAADVLERIKLRQALAESRPVKQAFEKLVKSNKSRVTKMQREIKRMQDDLQKKKVSTVKRSLRDQKRPEMSDDAIDAIRTINTKNVDEMYEGLLELKGTPFWANIRRGISSRDRELAEAMNDLDIFSQTLTSVNLQRKLDYQEILARADDKIQGRPAISRRVDGIDEVYFTIPEIESAAKNWGRVPLGAAGRIIATPVRVLRAGLTGALNPAFALKSLVRDGFESYVLSPRAMATHDPRNILGALADVTEQRPLLQEFLRTEGSSTFQDTFRKPLNASRQIMEQSRLTLPAVERKTKIITTPREYWRHFENTSRYQEQIGRYQNFRGAYNDAVKRGLNEADALVEARWAARNNQVDFFQTGDWTPIFSALYPYFNSSLQGGARIAGAFKQNPVTTSAKLVTAIQIPTVMATMYNLSDPRRASIYLDMPEYERQNNWIIVTPGSEKSDGRWEVVKIPKPPGVGYFSNPIEKMTASMYGEDPVKFADFARSVAMTISPFDVNSASGFAGSLIPQQIRPTVQSVANYDFFLQREIVPSWLKEQEPEPFMQHFDSTSTTARQIGKTLGISPLLADKFIQDTFGEGGRGITYGIDTVQSGIGTGETVGGRSTFESLKRNFISAAGGERQRAFSKGMDDLIQEKSNTSREITKKVNEGDIESASLMAQDYNRRVAELQALLEEYENMVSVTDNQKEYLDGLSFPMSGGRLSERSIRSRAGEFDR